MKKILQFLIVIVIQFLLNEAIASNYYLSENGNDIHSGKSTDYPWRTLAKLGKQMGLIEPGDSILFERGSSFWGTMEIRAVGIYIGSYGHGSKPVFNGHLALKQWKYTRNNIWVARCAACVTEPGNLFINGKPQLLGRYPNKNFLISTGTGKTQIALSDSTLTFPDNYWNDAEVVVRSSRWTLDNLTVDLYKNKTFTFNASASYSLLNGFGYFIQRHVSTLDQHGEWHFDSAEKMLYVYLNPKTKPSQYQISIGVHDTGLMISNSKNIHIEDMIFNGYALSGISIVNSSSIKLEGVEIIYAGKNGMDISSSNRVNIHNCSITGSNNNGVQWHNTTNSQFTQNQICRTGLHPGRGQSGNGTYIALYITSDLAKQAQNVFQHNTIDSVGYSAIDFRTGNTKIKGNIISNFCLIKDDGAGIYTWNNPLQGNHVEGNRISNGIGSGSGALSPAEQFAHGIYMDDRTSHVTIGNNEITRCSGSGIFLHNAKNITVMKNLAYANGRNISNQEKGQLYIRLDTLGQFGKHIDTQLKIEDNTWVADEINHCMYVSVEKNADLHQLGTFNHNRFGAAADHLAVAVMVRRDGSCRAEQVSLTSWQQTTQYEKNSVFESRVVPAYFKTVGSDKISNGSMTKNIEGWIIWPERSVISQEKIKILDGYSLKVTIPAGNTEALLYQGKISLDKGKMYRLSFTAISPDVNQVEFVPLMSLDPWQALGAYACFTIGSVQKNFTYYFVAGKSNANSRVNFKSHTDFWIDNVSLYEVVVN